jgi:hypothetical protein
MGLLFRKPTAKSVPKRPRKAKFEMSTQKNTDLSLNKHKSAFFIIFK